MTRLARLKSTSEDSVLSEDHMEEVLFAEEDITEVEDITEEADFAEEHFAESKAVPDRHR